jgi:predicted alpha/beta-fold hydrolase
MSGYDPLPRWTGGHRMTLYAWGNPRHFPALPAAQARYFDVSSDTRVLAHCHWQPRAWEHPTVLLLHGLESSSGAHYMLGLSHKAYGAGFNCVRLNQRNCGGTEHLSPGLYHSGLTNDPLKVMRELIEVDGLASLTVVGYSLGGNLALKLAGDFADAPPVELKAVCAVSPTMDLAECVDALERPSNRVYQWNFVRNLKNRMRRKARLFPDQFSAQALAGITTIRQFDDEYTAPYHRFRDAADYYHRASAVRVVHKIGIPTMIISAQDDPFVPPTPFHDPALLQNPHIRVRLPPHGGHCGFVEKRNGMYDGYWAEREIVEFLKHHCKT